MQKLKLTIVNMDADSEAKVVDKLKQIDGVLLVNIDVKSNSGLITFDEKKVESKVIAKAIISLGYTVLTDTKKSHGKILAITCGVAVVIALTIFIFAKYPSAWETLLRWFQY